VANIGVRLSPWTSRALVAVVFIISVVAGIQTAQYRYTELNLMAFTSYAVPLESHGISQHAFALYFLISEALIAATFALTGLFIALRGPKTPMAVFAAIALMLYGVTIPPPMHALVVNAPQLATWVMFERSIGFGLFIVFLYVFPDGRFSTWTVRLLSAAVLIWTALWPFVSAANPYQLPHPWPFVLIASAFASKSLLSHAARSARDRAGGRLHIGCCVRWRPGAESAQAGGDYFSGHGAAATALALGQAPDGAICWSRQRACDCVSSVSDFLVRGRRRWSGAAERREADADCMIHHLLVTSAPSNREFVDGVADLRRYSCAHVETSLCG